jgi:hypothetical protein
MFRDFTPAPMSGAFDFENGPTGPDQPNRENIGKTKHRD